MDYTVEEFTQLSLNRENIYLFLSRVFGKEVDQSLLELVSHMNNEHGAGGESRGFDKLARYLASAPDDPLSDLAADFTALFFGMGPTNDGAFPYESVYTSKDGLLMQEARDEMIAVLHEAGVAPTAKGAPMEDHISTELAFLAHLASKTRDALDASEVEKARAYDNAYAAFLKDHPLRWIPAFCEDVKRLARTDFYRGIAGITSDFLSLDAQLCGDTIIKG